jgi:16S rRNA C1402 N4-methylase RsmH
MSHFSNIVCHAHQLLSEVLHPGDLAVDLTAGNGADTLFLARAVGPIGCVLAFDIQEQALINTADRLRLAGLSSRRSPLSPSPALLPGVTLIGAGHEQLAEYLQAAPQGVIANLGYLPGGDETMITRSESTVVALRSTSDLLAAGGRLAVVVYPGHPGGEEEGKRVDALFSALSTKEWQLLRITVPNSVKAPYLLVAEKR